MDGSEPAPAARENVVRVFFTCVLCGAVEEIPVPREEGLPGKIYWECLACEMQAGGEGRTKSA